MIYSEKIALDNINKERAEIEKYRDTVFKQENVILKLEARIEALSKKKAEADKDLDDYYAFTREIYVVDPHETALILNDELSIYKNAYNNVTEHYRILFNRVRDYKEFINELKVERAATDKEWKCKTKAILQQKEKEFELDDDRTFNDNIRCSIPDTENDAKLLKTSKKNGKLKAIISASDAKLKESRKKIQINYNFNDITPIGSEDKIQEQFTLLSKLDLISEWREVVKIVGFTDEECNDIFYNNDRKTKFGESVDILSNMLANKNLQIKQMLEENRGLNQEIQVLYDNNHILQLNLDSCKSQIEVLKSRIEIHCDCKNKSNDQFSNTIENNRSGILGSIVGTPGSITINRLNIHTSVNQISRSNNLNTNFSGSKNYYNYYKNVAHPSEDEESCDSDIGNNCYKMDLKQQKLFNFKTKKAANAEGQNLKWKNSSPALATPSQPNERSDKHNFSKIKPKKTLFIQLDSDNRYNKEDFTLYKDTCESTEKVGTCKSRCSSNMKGRLFQKLNLQSTKYNSKALASDSKEFIRIQSNC